MPEVANPSVIIGLGGTGKWVLTYLKKSLLDTYGGEIPPTVRLLSFDTTTEKASRDGEQQEEDVRVGDIQLGPGTEFIYLGGNIEEICRDIRDKGHYPHIGSWLQAKSYLQAADSRAFDISGGAGQKRPFGRMAVFYDLQQLVSAKITNKISTAINEVISANKKRVTVEIYVIASLAGGTGAGMFIDVAHLARWYAAKHIRTGYAIRGFLALHNTFNTVINTNQVQPNAFAAMRELDRFMLVFDQQYPIVYNPNSDLTTVYGGQHGKLFDNCYLLDATRERMPLDGVPPKYGVYPSIADAITMLLDGTTGETYTQHYVNVNNRITEVQSRLKVPIYSSLGTFSLILPAEDIITSLANRFASDLLATHLLNLEERTNDAGQKQLVLVYEGDAKKEAAAFLQRPKSDKGLASTNFIQRVPNIVNERSLLDDAAIADVANMEAGELLAWIIPPESDPTVEELANKVREELEIRVASQVPPSSVEGDDPVDGCGRILKGVTDFKGNFLGREVGGRKVGGVYQKALERCRDIHRERYRKLLQEYLLNLLNGPSPTNRDYQAEKRGRLGQAQALLSHLSISYFNELSAFIDRIKARRAKDGDLQSAQEHASLLRSEMEMARSKSSFLSKFFKDLHPAVKAQQEYLAAEQEAIDLEVNDLFFEYLQQTTRALRTETEEFKAAVDAWVNTLAFGITGETNDPGLFHHLGAIARRHQTQREEKETRYQNVREYLTDATFETNLYTAQSKDKFAEVLSGMTWGFEEPSGVKHFTLTSFASASMPLRGGKSATERNAEMLISIARRYFEPLRESLNIADRLAEMDTLRLVRKLRDSCAAMIRLDTMRSGGEQDVSYFVCVNEGRQRSYFSDFRSELRQIGASTRENQVLDSSNPYTCTILSTADVFTSAGMHAYITAEREYNNYRSDARLLHIFPAEVNAVHFEQQLPTIKEERRRFSHTLTAMLENLDDVRRFVRADLYRFIRLAAVDTSTSCWRLFTTVAGGRRNSGIFDLTPVEPQPVLLQAMETFVFRKAAFDNKTRSLNFEQLDHELDQLEQEASGGDGSRLINMFEDLIDLDIELMRQSRDQNTHDLGSLMRLLIGETIGTLQARIKNGGRAYDPDAKPLFDVRKRGQAEDAPPPPPPVPPVSPTPTAPPPEPPLVTTPPVTPPSSTDGNVAKLRDLHAMLQDDDISPKVFLKRVGQLLEEGDVLGLKTVSTMFQEGDISEEVFIKRVTNALSKLG